VNDDKGKIKFKEIYEQTGFFDDEDDLYYSPTEYSRYDFGIYVGGGFGVKAGVSTLCLDIRYGIGFIDFYKDAYFISHTKSSSYKPFNNRNLSITLSILFGKSEDSDIDD